MRNLILLVMVALPSLAQNVASNQTDWYLNGVLSALISTNGVIPSKILLVLPPSASPETAGNSSQNDQAWFNSKVQQIASTWGTALLNPGLTNPKFTSFQAQSDAGWMLTDGVHLNTSGQSALFAAIKTALGI